MPDNFQQTINLKDKIAAKPADPIEKIYNPEDGKNIREITKPNPVSFRISETWLKAVLILTALLMIFFIVRGFVGKKENKQAETPPNKWYAVKLLDGETLFGQIASEDQMRLVLKNVYYNYDQVKNGTSTEMNPGGNLRLVKLGKESYGPDGTREILQDKIIYKDPLRADSKVLKAILEYEK